MFFHSFALDIGLDSDQDCKDIDKFCKMEILQMEEEEHKKIGDEARLGESAESVRSKIEELEVQSNKKLKDDKNRKRYDKSMEQVLKALSALGTSEEKLAAICKKYTEMVDENRKLHLQLKQFEKKNIVLQREKDQLLSEQSKAVLTRSRLENLCRELQKQNKAIKEESLLKIREEEEKRKVVSAKFQTALGEITALMQQNNENNSKLRNENLEMQNKFKTLCEQYELREQQVEKMSKQMQLESQLADVKIAKVKIDMFAEKELLANEKEQLMVELAACQNKCQEMQKNEATLRNQISMYTEKYDEFQSALAKSNQIYANFKTEMEKMSKKISKLERETSVWKMKWEGSHKALLQMVAEKQQRDADLSLTTKQLNQLQKLCRTLQSERASLFMQLKNEKPASKVADQNLITEDNDNKPNTNLVKTLSEVIEDNQKETEQSSEKILVEKENILKNGNSVITEIDDVEQEVRPENDLLSNKKNSSEKILQKKSQSGESLKEDSVTVAHANSEVQKKSKNYMKSKVNESKKGKDGSKKRKK